MSDPKNRSTMTVFMPLMLAVMLVAGLFIGNNIGNKDGYSSRTFFIDRQVSATDKLGQVVDYIERQYVDSVEKQALVEGVIDDLLADLDPHSYYISAAELKAFQEPLEGSFDGIGVEFMLNRDTVIVISPVEGGPSEALGIRAGDRIIAADGEKIAGVGINNKGVMEKLRGPKNSEVVVRILRAGTKKPFDVTIERGAIPINSVAVSLMTEPTTGYIKLVRFAKNTHHEFMDAVHELKKKGMERLVLDLRGNGGGYLNSAVAMADEFLPEGEVIVYTEGRSRPRRTSYATDDGELDQLPLAILIDEGSASASEVLAGALQDNDRAIVVGRRSFGKGLVQEHVELPDESAIRLTTARYYTPTGRCIQKPYGEGIDYQSESYLRAQHGELLSADSVHMDSTEVFTTRGGKTVFGGGGIMPDVFVAVDTSSGSAYLSELFYTGTLNQFAFDRADSERQELERLEGPSEFDRTYQISARLLSDLKAFAEERGIEDRPGEMDRSRDEIATRLKANIARNIWGSEGYYPILLQRDVMLREAQAELGKGG